MKCTWVSSGIAELNAGVRQSRENAEAAEVALHTARRDYKGEQLERGHLNLVAAQEAAHGTPEFRRVADQALGAVVDFLHSSSPQDIGVIARTSLRSETGQSERRRPTRLRGRRNSGDDEDEAIDRMEIEHTDAQPEPYQKIVPGDERVRVRVAVSPERGKSRISYYSPESKKEIGLDFYWQGAIEAEITELMREQGYTGPSFRQLDGSIVFSR